MNGKNVLIHVEDLDNPGTYLLVAKQKDGSISRSKGTIDATTKDSGGWEESEHGLKSWSQSVEQAYMKDDVGYLTIERAYNEGLDLNIRVVGLSDTHNYEGKAIIETLDVSFPNNDIISASYSLKGNGPLARVVKPA